MRHLTLVPTQRPQPLENEWGFNSRDLIALTCWMQRADAHGYRRVLIEGGTGEGGPEEGGYVLIYPPQQDWARWGLARSGEQIVIWNCGTGADLGRFPTMLQALESLPPVRTQPGGRSKARVTRVEPDRPVSRFNVVHPN